MRQFVENFTKHTYHMATTKQHRSHPVGLSRIRFEWQGQQHFRCYQIENGEPVWVDCSPFFGGLGDAVAAVTKAVGVKPCGGCKKRQAALNKVTPGWLSRILLQTSRVVDRLRACVRMR